MARDRVWMGQLVDSRVIGDWEDLPVDAPATLAGAPRWKHTWSCTNRLCGAPSGVPCRCREVLVGEGHRIASLADQQTLREKARIRAVVADLELDDETPPDFEQLRKKPP